MNYRNTRCYLNCEKRIFEGEGIYEFPTIEPIEMDVENTPMIGFNYANTEKKPEDKICHFFIDDYQFDRVWNDADRYLGVLRRFKAVISPDFSTYMDFPKAVQIYNTYRRQWCGAYWQENGINVIPTVRWMGEGSEEWCFDGIKKGSMICISTVGGFREKEVTKVWLEGYQKVLDYVEPSFILFYGKKHDCIPTPVPYTVAVNLNTLNRKLARERMDAEEKSRMYV